jgi:hypothetical protein
LDAEQAEAVALLALVAGQDVEPGQRPGTWRIARRVAPTIMNGNTRIAVLKERGVVLTRPR